MARPIRMRVNTSCLVTLSVAHGMTAGEARAILKDALTVVLREVGDDVRLIRLETARGPGQKRTRNAPGSGA